MPTVRGDDGSPVIRCLEDIKEIIKNFTPSEVSEDKRISTSITSEGHTYNVSVDLKNQDPREQLIEGFDIIKRRLEVLQKLGATSQNSPITTDGYMWLDRMIKMRLGGARDGLRVKWTVASGTYLFDPYTGKLFKQE